MSSLLQKAAAIPTRRKNQMVIGKEDVDLFIAWATGKVNSPQVCEVLSITKSSRASFYSWAAQAARYALNNGYMVTPAMPPPDTNPEIYR